MHRVLFGSLETLAVLACLWASPARAGTYDTGASDTEIRIGNTNPYSGKASAYGTIGRALSAYFEMLNARGGVNGRKIAFITLDDAYNPAKTVEQVRRLVESDEVLAVYQVLGTPGNTAIQKYLNDKGVPQLFIATGATKWADPKNFPWTMAWQPSYQTEARIYARYILDNVPDAKVSVLYQNDDYGKDYLKGLRDGLGDKADKIVVATNSYETTDATIDSQIVQLSQSGANVFVNVATPKWATQAIKKIADLGWKPLHILNNVSNSIPAVLAPAGLAKARGIVSSAYYKIPGDPKWANDPALLAYRAFMQAHFPDGNPDDSLNVYAYGAAMTLEHVLRAAGDTLTRENLMRQAASLKGVELPILLPGIRMNTSPSDFAPIEEMQMEHFNGTSWELFGPVVSGAAGS